MSNSMRLSEHGGNDAINRRISLLVLNNQAEQAILHENAESQNEPLSVLPSPTTSPSASGTTAPQPDSRWLREHGYQRFLSNIFWWGRRAVGRYGTASAGSGGGWPWRWTVERDLPRGALDQGRGGHFRLLRAAGNDASDGEPAGWGTPRGDEAQHRYYQPVFGNQRYYAGTARRL